MSEGAGSTRSSPSKPQNAGGISITTRSTACGIGLAEIEVFRTLEARREDSLI
jgi:hypothetical protein